MCFLKYVTVYQKQLIALVVFFVFGLNHSICAAGKAKSGSLGGYYAEGGLSHYSNTLLGDFGKHNTISVSPMPNNQLVPFNYKNNDFYTKGLGGYIGGGYQWRLSNDVSWRIGERLSHYNLAQKGTFGQNISQHYRYDINEWTFNVVFGVNWNAFSHNVFYIEAETGIARLTSKHFRFSNTSDHLNHTSNTRENIDYGLNAGWIYQISEHTGLDISVGYVNSGMASLGTREVPLGAVSRGEINQKVEGIIINAGVKYLF